MKTCMRIAQAIQKVRAALKGRENRSAAVYRLFTALPQGKQTFNVWHRKILESARRVDWENYGFEKAAVDAVLIQTSSTKLRQKALQDNLDWNQLVDMGMGQEQAQKKVQAMPDRERETERQIDREQSRAEQSRAEQSRAEQSRAEQS